MAKLFTRKAYEELLNENNIEFYYIDYSRSTAGKGSYVRRTDPIAFNEEYFNYCDSMGYKTN